LHYFIHRNDTALIYQRPLEGHSKMFSAVYALRAVTRAHVPVSQVGAAAFHRTAARLDFHFDTHHFVQRLEREGLNRQQAEGIMAAMAEVIDESIRNMTANMVTKADQEKVCTQPKIPLSLRFVTPGFIIASIQTAGGLCPAQVRTAHDGEE
jgi:hypothetical protein